MVTAAFRRARGTIVRGGNMPGAPRSLKKFYPKPWLRGDDLLPVNCCGQHCREKFLESCALIPLVVEVEIASIKQDRDQLMPALSMVKVSTRSIGLPNGGHAVAILRQGLVMWITILQ
ncbi:hypothetical protein [Caulobacter segnis]